MSLSEISIRKISGIGEKKFSVLSSETGIKTIEDLLLFSPRRYIDRSSCPKISDIIPSDREISVIGKVTEISVINSSRRLLKVEISDGSGSLSGIFFGGIRYFIKLFEKNDTVVFSGRPEINFGRIQIVHPEFDFISGEIETLNTARIVPVYPLTENLRTHGINTRFLRKIIKAAVDAYLSEATVKLPLSVIKKFDLIDYKDALLFLHFPKTMMQVEHSRKHLAFTELFFFILYASLKRIIYRIDSTKAGLVFSRDLFEKVISSLPFSLTADQEKAVNEIKSDILSKFPMNRLLQGDVGSGKTAVAVLSLAIHALAGNQTAFMAPTEVLARQHFIFCRKYFSSFFNIDYLSGSSTAAEKKIIYENLENGVTSMIVGTHSLFQKNVRFRNLRCIVIDEQHRFGVEQRLSLHKKGTDADILVMTATPIPRSLALTVFGDLDVSVIREKPSGRASVKTLVFHENRIRGVYNSIRKYITAGRQCYYVLPLIEETEKSDLKSAKEIHLKLSSVFTDYRVEILHGRMTSDEKIAIMKDFEENRISILVSTTVIEVGVDVPNANIIVIHHAERFGLSQIHQLRGRVGRGQHESFCVLLYPDACPEESIKRLKFLEGCNDGFRISEYDLKIRGAGQLSGFIQHGFRSEFRFLDPANDTQMIISARDVIDEIISEKQHIIENKKDKLRSIIEKPGKLTNTGEILFQVIKYR